MSRLDTARTRGKNASTPLSTSAGRLAKSSANTERFVRPTKSHGIDEQVHLPGTQEPFDFEPDTTNQLEKRYFLPGNLGFPAFRAPSLRHEGGSSPIIGQLICNDRRWAEGWRCYGLQGVEIVCCGYVSAFTRRH